MADAQPTQVPGDVQDAGAAAAASTVDAPSQSPPALADGGGAAGAAATRTMTAPPELQFAPSLPATATSAGSGVSAWQNSKKIEALWTINQDRNSWMGVVGIGWRKFAPGTETSLTAMTMLAAHARCTNSVINYRDESDSLVHEIYVW